MTDDRGIRTSRRGDVVVAIAEVRELESEHVASLLEGPESVGALVLDLARVECLGTECLGALVEVRRTYSDAGRRFVLAGLQATVAEVLAVTKLGRLFEYRSDVDDALRHLPPD